MEDIIAVSAEESLKGKSDEFLLGLGVMNNAILITRDREFFNNYPGKTIYYSKKMAWKDIYDKINSYNSNHLRKSI